MANPASTEFVGSHEPGTMTKRVRPSILSQSVNPAKLYLNLRYTLGARSVRTKDPLAR
jgi:hypothetical protein